MNAQWFSSLIITILILAFASPVWAGGMPATGKTVPTTPKVTTVAPTVPKVLVSPAVAPAPVPPKVPMPTAPRVKTVPAVKTAPAVKPAMRSTVPVVKPPVRPKVPAVTRTPAVNTSSSVGKTPAVIRAPITRVPAGRVGKEIGHTKRDVDKLGGKDMDMKGVVDPAGANLLGEQLRGGAGPRGESPGGTKGINNEGSFDGLGGRNGPGGPGAPTGKKDVSSFGPANGPRDQQPTSGLSRGGSLKNGGDSHLMENNVDAGGSSAGGSSAGGSDTGGSDTGKVVGTWTPEQKKTSEFRKVIGRLWNRISSVLPDAKDGTKDGHGTKGSGGVRGMPNPEGDGVRPTMSESQQQEAIEKRAKQKKDMVGDPGLDGSVTRAPLQTQGDLESRLGSQTLTDNAGEGGDMPVPVHSQSRKLPGKSTLVNPGTPDGPGGLEGPEVGSGGSKPSSGSGN